MNHYSVTGSSERHKSDRISRDNKLPPFDMKFGSEIVFVHHDDFQYAHLDCLTSRYSAKSHSLKDLQA